MQLGRGCTEHCLISQSIFLFLQNGMTYGSIDLGLNPSAVKDGFDSSFRVRYEVNGLNSDMTMGSELRFRGR